MSEFYLLFEDCKSLDDEIQFERYDGPVQANHKHLRTRAFLPKLKINAKCANDYCKQLFLDEMCKCIKTLKTQYSSMTTDNEQFKVHVDSSLSIKIGKKYFLSNARFNERCWTARCSIRGLVEERPRSSFMDRTVIRDASAFKNELQTNGYRPHSSGIGKYFMAA
jgi:hypothetical protein